MRDVAGKVAVVTGGASPRGIGHATGALLAGEGMAVVLADIDAAALDATVADIAAAGGEVSGVVTDVSDFASVQHLAAEVYARHGRADVVFLNAGIGGGGSLFDDEMDSWRRVVGINFMGVLRASRRSSPACWRRGATATCWRPARARV